jgi:hypothetical protein
MVSDASRVIVKTGATASTALVHHRDFPDIRAEGESPELAARNLSNQLTRALDSALTNWRRETLQHAIEDVLAFVAGKA